MPNTPFFAWGRVALGVAAGLIVAGGIVGCDESKTHRLLFSHALHVTENEMACDECHAEISPENGFKALTHASCSDCHDDLDGEEVTAETCGVCHGAAETVDAIKLDVSRKSRKPSRVFVHTEALAGKCDSCHQGLLKEDLTSVPRLDRDDIVRLRNVLHRQDRACSDCHLDMDPGVAPADHRVEWDLRHGEFGRRDDAACSVCHTEDSCRECHEVTSPANHSLLWRTKLHGVQASWDRESCQMCHEQDGCQSCHEEVRPRSHNAAWRRNHCYQCHASAADGTGCAVCHQGELLETHPNPHEAGFRQRHCDTCHPGTPQAEQCTLCHPGGFEAHPNPHSGGWRARHCDSCHADSPQRDRCNLCHETTLATHSSPHPSGWLARHCDSCHADSPQQDRCNLCHETTLATHPNPHKAGWREQHCANCHEGPQSANECGVCHPGAGSLLVHDSFWPPVHNRFGTAVACDFCHF